MLASLESRRNKAARRDRAVLDLLVEQIEQQLLVAKRAIFSPILMACETSGCRARLFLSPPILVGGIACALDQQKQRNPQYTFTQPAALSCASCETRLWPSVLTLA
jgi:hypothetical protein